MIIGDSINWAAHTVSMTVINSRVPSCVTRGGRLPALQITFARFGIVTLGKALFIHIIYIFGQEVALLGGLLKLMEIVDNGPGATCQCMLAVQI